jgi:hypothetical protein
VPGGAWNDEEGLWRSAHRRFLFGKDALAKAFQARFIRRLEALRRRSQLVYAGEAAAWAESPAWSAFIQRLWAVKWVVYPKATGKNPEQALDYLARYTHKVAISDHRILALDNRHVTFSWRDREDGNRLKTCPLPAEDFIARFLLHILPPGFRKIRFYGWLSPSKKQTVLSAIRAALGAPSPEPPPEESTAERILRLTGVEVRRCPGCGKSSLIYVGCIGPVAARAPP